MKMDSLGRMRGAPIQDKIFAFSIQVAECGCWIWERGAWGSGYGVIKVRNRSMSAHKASFEAFVGDVPEGLHVLHRCGIKSCVNPDHLFLGTHLENIQDALRKGLIKPPKRGEENHNAKLSNDNVESIRRRYAEGGVRQVDLAAEFGVTQGCISAITRGASRIKNKEVSQ